MKTTTLGIRILKEEKEALQKEADVRGLSLSELVKEMICEKTTKKVDVSSSDKNLIPKKENPKNKEEKEFDNLLECAILFQEKKMDI